MTANRRVDRFAGPDPGLNRFRLALQSVMSIGAILAAEALFVRFMRALKIRARGAMLPAAQMASRRRPFVSSPNTATVTTETSATAPTST
jgi:hypothetical protein